MVHFGFGAPHATAGLAQARSKLPNAFLLTLLLALSVPGLTGCETARFYRQAVVGQWEVLAERRPVEAVMECSETSARLKAQLRRVHELCRFAETDLGLPARGQYTRYADLGRPFVVWNVFAAPEFSLEAKSWWYPFVGRLDYRGYFRKDLALSYARNLRERGCDVHVAGVDAYSTLGWFSDPVLNTFVFLPEVELADLVFHELAHQHLFISGDTEVNEAFAKTVAREGVRRWLAAVGSGKQLAEYLEGQRRDDAVVEMIGEARQRLERLYAAAAVLPLETLRRRKAEVFSGLQEAYEVRKREWPGYEGYDGWMAGPLNNAQLNSVDAYTRWVPALEVVLDGAGDELQGFYRVMEKLRRRSKQERHAVLAWFEEQAATARHLATVPKGDSRAP